MCTCVHVQYLHIVSDIVYIFCDLFILSYAAEMEKLKHTTMVSEKLRREKWRSDETQRIKEATVKSLEPEIQRIIARGKAEIQKLKAMHEVTLGSAI